MKKLCSAVMLFALTLGLNEATLANPISYSFTANDFRSFNGSSVPFNSITGTFTLDDSVITQIDLTIGTYRFAPEEILYDPSLPLIGGNLNGSSIAWGTDDFWLIWNSDTLTFGNFNYSISGTDDIFSTTVGSITPIVAPIPGTAWLFGSGTLGVLGAVNRRKLV